MTEEKVIPLKTATFDDLIRLAVSTILPTQVGVYLLRFYTGNKIVIGLLGVFRDYYKQYGLPIFYYYTFDINNQTIQEANYIIITTDKYEFSKTPRPGVVIPIITLAHKPPFIPDNLE